MVIIVIILFKGNCKVISNLINLLFLKIQKLQAGDTKQTFFELGNISSQFTEFTNRQLYIFLKNLSEVTVISQKTERSPHSVTVVMCTVYKEKRNSYQ